MRLEVDSSIPVFTTEKDAVTKLVAKNKIDDEDAAFIKEEATNMQTAGGDPAKAMKLSIQNYITTNSDKFDGKYSKHIFKGDFDKDGIPTGFHSTIGGSDTHEAYGAKTILGNGVYQQSVKAKNSALKKKNQSTFFPDNATHQNVIDAITVVMGYGLSSVQYVDKSVDGISLEKRGETVFPAGGSDKRLSI